MMSNNNTENFTLSELSEAIKEAWDINVYDYVIQGEVINTLTNVGKVIDKAGEEQVVFKVLKNISTGSVEDYEIVITELPKSLIGGLI